MSITPETFDTLDNFQGYGEIPRQSGRINDGYGEHVASYGELAITNILDAHEGQLSPTDQEIVNYLAAQDELIAGLKHSQSQGERDHYNDELEKLSMAYPTLHATAMDQRKNAMRSRLA